MSIFPHHGNRMDAAGLAAAIDEIGIEIDELAARVGVWPRTVKRWLNGSVPVPASVALLLNVAVDARRWSHVVDDE